MKNLLGTTALAAILTVGIVQIASAAPMSFDAVLSGSSEVPPTGSPGSGVTFVVIDPVANTMSVFVTFSGLTGATTASHIHCCLASPGLMGVNVMVATTTPTFTGFPGGVMSGTYSQTFDMTAASSYNPAFITSAFDPAHTVAGAEAALFAGIENDETYLNIHTNVFPGGEIRGYLVPEPVTWTLFGAGLVGAFAMRRRQKRA
jgi:hypothetical protein